MLPAITFSSAMHGDLFFLSARSLSISLLFMLSGSAIAVTCPSEFMARASSKMGYGPAASGEYCEGMLQEMHSASMTVQVFQFATVTDSLTGARVIYVGIPPAIPSIAVEITGLAAYVPYRFDATIAAGGRIRLALDKIIVPASIPVASLGFVARRQDMPSMLVPVLLSGQAQASAAHAYLFGVRSNLQVAEVHYSIIDEAGTTRLEKTIPHDFAPAEVIPLQIGILPPGRYGLTVRTRQTPGDPAHDGMLYQRFTIP